MEISLVRKRLIAEIERARQEAQRRRARIADAQRAYETFLSEVAVPVARMVANVLKAEGYAFTFATPGGGLRLTSDKTRDDFIELALDSAHDPPQVVGRISRVRGSRTIDQERPVKPGASPEAIGEDDMLEFFVTALAPWLER